MNQPCYKCHQLTPHPVMSGAGVDRRALCPTCYTVTRAVAHIDVEAVAAEVVGGTLGERMAAARERMSA